MNKKEKQQPPANFKIPKFSYIELSEWWSQHKNSLQKEETDMPPICYESKSLFDMISQTANLPKSSESRQWIEALSDYKQGIRTKNQFGYQYNMGSFPVMFSQIEKTRPTPKSQNQKVGSSKKQEYHDGASVGADQETNENSNIGLNINADEPNIGAKKASMLTVLSNPHANATPVFNGADSSNGPNNVKVRNHGGNRPHTRGDGHRAKPLLTN